MRISIHMKDCLRMIMRAMFFIFCILLIYFFYRWNPAPIKPINFVFHNLPLLLASSPSAVEEYYYQTFVNDSDTQEVILYIKDKQGRLWVSAKNIEAWRLRIPNVLPVTYDNEKYYSLSQFPGLTYKIDNENLIIRIKAPFQLFEANMINANASQINKFISPSPGLFFDYNLFDTKQAGPEADNLFTGFFQLGMFNPYGVGTTSFINQNAPNTETFLRLLTTWRYDNPDRMWTFSAGDDVSAVTNWSSSVNFGGFQWGTNFTTQPNFITFPQPGVAGQANVSSALELYINNTGVLQQKISPGSYQVYNIPYIDGFGNMSVVQTDIMGRQQQVTIPFYSSTNLLKSGLADYTYEFGMIRQNLGLTSFDYARFLAAATRSVGINDKFTFQWHVEGLSDQQTLGFSAFQQLSTIGIFNGSAAISHINVDNKDGGMLMAGFQRQALNYTINISSEITTLYFTQQGITPGDFSPRLINQVAGGFSFSGNSISAIYIRQINRDLPGNNSISATYSRNVLFGIALSISGISNLGGTKNKGVFFSLTRALGESTSGSINNSIQNDSHQESIALTRGLPQGPGYGYNLIGSTGSSINNKLGSLSLQNDIGTYEGSVIQNNGQTTYSLNVQGSAVYLGGQSYLTRNLQGNSFGIVQLPGYSNVDVYINNQLTARTDKNGNALIPDLLPYQQTDIKIDPNTLPISANITETSVTVAPYYSSGIIVPFNVQHVNGFTLTLKQASGDFVPEGSTIKVQGQEDESIVGSNGEVYLTNISGVTALDVSWEGHACKAVVSAPLNDLDKSIPDIGTLICREVTSAQGKTTSVFASN
jgi:outer membrane usher protein